MTFSMLHSMLNHSAAVYADGLFCPALLSSMPFSMLHSMLNHSAAVYADELLNIDKIICFSWAPRFFSFVEFFPFVESP